MNATLNMTTNWPLSLPRTAPRAAHPARRVAPKPVDNCPPGTLAHETATLVRDSAEAARREGWLLLLLAAGAGFALALNSAALDQFSSGFAAFETLLRSVVG
ncbi:MAG: hypothetical protein ACKVYV_07305 [Limisphaerales bacterium]